MTKHDVNYLLLWIHSAFAATSFAFFLALLSSSESTQCSSGIVFSSIFFSISLIVNSSLVFTLVWLKECGDVLESIFKNDKGWRLIKVALLSFLLGLAGFLFHYSFWFLLVAILSGVVSYLLLSNAFFSISRNYREK